MIYIVYPSKTRRGTYHYSIKLLSLISSSGLPVKLLQPTSTLPPILWELLLPFILRPKSSATYVFTTGRVSPLFCLFPCNKTLVIHDFFRSSPSHSSVHSIPTLLEYLVSVYHWFLSEVAILLKPIYILSNSYQTKKHLVARYPNATTNSSVLYPPPSFTSSDIDSFRTNLSAHYLYSNPQSFLFVTGRTPNKGFPLALHFILTSLNAYTTHIVGIRIPSTTNPCIQSAIDPDSISHSQTNLIYHSTLTQRSLLSLYSSCTFSLCLSLDEGFGIPFLDSLLFNIPTIVRDIPIYREVYTTVQTYLGVDHIQPFWIGSSVDHRDLNRYIQHYSQDPSLLKRLSHYQENLVRLHDLYETQYSAFIHRTVPNLH